MNNRQIRQVFSRIGLGMFLFLLIPYTATIALNVLCYRYAPQIIDSDWYYWVSSYGALYLMAFPVLLMVLSTIPNGFCGPLAKTSLSVKQILHLSLIGCGIMYPLSFMTSVLSETVSTAIGTESSNPLVDAFLQNNPWLTLFISVIVAPIMEELIFRGILYKKLIYFGGKIYILVSSFLFALFHTNLSQLFYAFALGLLLGAVSYYTGHIKYCIILHMIINMIGGGVSVLLIYYNLEALFLLWGICIILLTFMGFASAIKWWERHRRFYFAPPVIWIKNKNVIFLNFGMLLFTLSAVSLTVIVFLLV